MNIFFFKFLFYGEASCGNHFKQAQDRMEVSCLSCGFKDFFQILVSKIIALDSIKELSNNNIKLFFLGNCPRKKKNNLLQSLHEFCYHMYFEDKLIIADI